MLALRAARRAPTLSQVSKALYSTSGKDGSVAQSREFNKKEKAHEDFYVRQREEAQMRKLHEALEQRKKEIAELEAERAKLEEKQNKD